MNNVLSVVINPLLKGYRPGLKNSPFPGWTEETERKGRRISIKCHLDFIPGLGPKSMEKLLVAFGTEMNILHEVTLEQLMEIVPEKLAVYIDSARKGDAFF